MKPPHVTKLSSVPSKTIRTWSERRGHGDVSRGEESVRGGDSQISQFGGRRSGRHHQASPARDGQHRHRRQSPAASPHLPEKARRLNRHRTQGGMELVESSVGTKFGVCLCVCACVCVCAHVCGWERFCWWVCEGGCE